MTSSRPAEEQLRPASNNVSSGAVSEVREIGVDVPDVRVEVCQVVMLSEVVDEVSVLLVLVRVVPVVDGVREVVDVVVPAQMLLYWSLALPGSPAKLKITLWSEKCTQP